MRNKNFVVLAIVCLSTVMASLSYADVGDSAFEKVGFINLTNHQNSAFIDSSTNQLIPTTFGIMQVSPTSTRHQHGYLYSYSLNLKPNSNLTQAIQLSSQKGYTCLIEFKVITPAQASFKVTDSPGVGCGIDKEGNISYLSY